MKIRLLVEGASFAATLDEGAAARDFAALLPLALVLEDYEATEKIADLPRRLSTAGAPAGTAPSAGDIAYYSPWGNLALFYKDSGYAHGLVKLGRIEGAADMLRRPGKVSVTIERLEA